jgi:hypothetical protein
MKARKIVPHDIARAETTPLIYVAPDEPLRRGRLACLDLVEDRTRNRLVSVAVMFAMYLVMSNSFLFDQPPPSIELVKTLTFASVVPTAGTLGDVPLFSRPPQLLVESNKGRAFRTRTCPSEEIKSQCDRDTSYTEGVAVSARVTSLQYATEPRNTLDCSSAKRTQLAGRLAWETRDQACTPVLRYASNTTDELGTAHLSQMQVVS